MRRTVLLLALTALLAVGLGVAPGWGASSVRVPAPPRAKAGVVDNQASAPASTVQAPSAPSGFCINIDRDNKWTCVGRKKPASQTGCRVLIGLDDLVNYDKCGVGGGQAVLSPRLR